MNVKTRMHNCTFLFLFVSLLAITGCATRYGYDYIDKDVIRAAAPIYQKPQLQCSLNNHLLLLNLTRQKTLQDYKYTYREGKCHYHKEYKYFSTAEKKILLPTTTPFPCLTGVINSSSDVKQYDGQNNIEYLSENFFPNMYAWGPMFGHYALISTVLAGADLVYHAGGFCWSLAAIPVHYMISRSVVSNTYRENDPSFAFVFMGLPVVNLFFPGYVSPGNNSGPMLTKYELYSKPDLISKKLYKEITLQEIQPINKGANVDLSYRGKTYKTKVSVSGKISLPFKIYPLPVRKEKITVKLAAYATSFSSKPVTIQKDLTFDTVQFLTPAQKKAWDSVNSKSQNYMMRFRAMQQLRTIILPEEFKKFQTAPEKYLNK